MVGENDEGRKEKELQESSLRKWDGHSWDPGHYGDVGCGWKHGQFTSLKEGRQRAEYGCRASGGTGGEKMLSNRQFNCSYFLSDT